MFALTAAPRGNTLPELESRDCGNSSCLFRNPVEQWYRGNDVEIGVREFLVQDPDGYLLRFSARIGERKHCA